MARLIVSAESWPIAGSFTISRGSRTEARVVVATVEHEGFAGRGECVPYARYGETVEGVAAQIEAMAGAISLGARRADLLDLSSRAAQRATRSIARFGTWRRKRPASAFGIWPDCPNRGPS